MRASCREEVLDITTLSQTVTRELVIIHSLIQEVDNGAQKKIRRSRYAGREVVEERTTEFVARTEGCGDQKGHHGDEHGEWAA